MAPAPKSLLQIAGAPLHPSALDKSALVIIDAQLEYSSKGNLPLDGVDAAIVEATKVLKLARERGVPVFHIVQHAPSGRPLFAEDGPTAAIVPLLTPAAGEVVVRKNLPNSFAGTDLDALVKSTGRSELILAGFMTHMCVSATARAALDLKSQNHCCRERHRDPRPARSARWHDSRERRASRGAVRTGGSFCDCREGYRGADGGGTSGGLKQLTFFDVVYTLRLYVLALNCTHWRDRKDFMTINGLTALRQNDSRSICRWRPRTDSNGMTTRIAGT